MPVGAVDAEELRGWRGAGPSSTGRGAQAGAGILKVPERIQCS